MPYSQVVEQRYRLQPADLGGPVLVVISNVTLQGLERLRPVLHFDRFDKRLVLDDVQSDEMARITGSAIFADWMGQEVLLAPISGVDENRITLLPPHARPPRTPQQQPHQPNPTANEPAQPPEPDSQAVDYRALLDRSPVTWQALLLSLLIVLLIVLLLAAIYALNNTELLWRYWEEFSFPPRSP